MLRALRCVDEVVVVDSLMDALSRYKPAVFVKGCDYEGKIQPEHESYCAAHGIRIRITETPKWSATEIGHALRAG